MSMPDMQIRSCADLIWVCVGQARGVAVVVNTDLGGSRQSVCVGQRDLSEAAEYAGQEQQDLE